MSKELFAKRRRELRHLCQIFHYPTRKWVNFLKQERRMIDDLKREGLVYWGAPGKELPKNRHGAFYSMFTIKRG